MLNVVSAARKLIAVVPATDRVVSFPEGATISQYGKCSSSPAIVVQNKTDGGSWQGALSGHYIIVNEVNEEAANAFLTSLSDVYTVEQLEVALAVLASKGFGDQYTTDLAFVSSKLSPCGLTFGLVLKDSKIEKITSGLVKRDDRDVCKVYRDADGIAQIVVKDQPRRIEDDILYRTYRLADGGLIDLSKIPTVS